MSEVIQTPKDVTVSVPSGGKDAAKSTATAVSPTTVIAIVLGLTTVGLLASTIVLAARDTSPTPLSDVATPAGDTFTAGRTVENVCKDTKPATGYDNKECIETGVKEQAGADVTEGYQGEMVVTHQPITTPYFEAGLCPVNVHWHLGAEHRSEGQYDETGGKGPTEIAAHRRLSGETRAGFQCRLYDDAVPKFTTEFDWQHCKDMEVGQTYEVHWPHSAGGACGTPNQYQTPFYDGVFCHSDKLVTTHGSIGVQSQTFTVVNDEEYYYPDLMKGMIVSGDYGAEVTKYTGSTTGTTRDNDTCSSYTPITWQVRFGRYF